jgi:hypothetical protein
VHDRRVEHASGVGIWLPECFEDFSGRTFTPGRRQWLRICTAEVCLLYVPVAEMPDRPRPLRERGLQSPVACGDDRKTGRYLRACGADFANPRANARFRLWMPVQQLRVGYD